MNFIVVRLRFFFYPITAFAVSQQKITGQRPEPAKGKIMVVKACGICYNNKPSISKSGE
jgi:hypothetical protein